MSNKSNKEIDTEKAMRNSTIDVIKGFAIILVIITHFRWTSTQRLFFIFPYIINMAIPVFMVITGYVYSLSFDRTLKGSLADAYHKKILLKRIMRYTLPVMVVAVWELFDKRINSPSAFLETIKWALNGTYGQGNYYYPVMIQMIFIFPLIMYAFERKKEKALMVCFLVTAAYELFTWAYSMNVECYRLLSFRYVFTVAAGVYTYKQYKLKTVIAIILTLTGAMFITFITYLNYTPPVVNAQWASTNFISSLMIVPLMIWVLQTVHLRCIPLEILGKASYHIFLVQMVYYIGYSPIIETCFSSWQDQLVISVMICLIVGVIFYCFDQPVQLRLYKYLEKKMRQLG